MKKLSIILLIILVILSVTGCTKSSENKNMTENNNNVISETNEENNFVNTELETEPTNKSEELKILVAYFSATNTTKGIAEYIADELDDDIYKIIPEEPYTDEDLNYGNSNSRSTIEMNDETSRPVISSSVENMEQYDIVFVGYPIWWGQAPRIMNTFIESYDFSGKTIIPFCTSASSGIGSSATNLENFTNNAQWLSGERFSNVSSRDKIIEWINSLDITAK